MTLDIGGLWMTDSIAKHIQRRVKQGRGQGIGVNYKPWYTAKIISSLGRTFRPKGIKTERESLFLSEWENFYFLLLDWSDRVSDIREQFPLLDSGCDNIQETIEIARGLNVEHPMERPQNVLKVMTTDFLVTFNDGSEVAVHFKPWKSITAREVEKMEIERLYWAQRGIQWELVTEKDISVAYAKNIEFVHNVYDLSNYQISESMIEKVRRLMEPQLLMKTRKFTDITNDIDDRLGLLPGNSLTIARHLIITKKWIVNMEKIIKPHMPLQILQIPITTEIGEERKYAN